MNAGTWDHALLDAIWQIRLRDPLALLLLRDMALIADHQGRAPLVTLATRFRNFFRKRRAEGKAEFAALDSTVVAASGFDSGEWTVEWWTEAILSRALTDLNAKLMHRDGDSLVWATGTWTRWSPGFRKAIRNIAETRLIEYFDTKAAGGW